MGLKPSSQTQPMVIVFGAWCFFRAFVIGSGISKEEVSVVSEKLNQLLDSEDVVKSNSEWFVSSLPKISSFINEVSVATNGRNVTGSRCCSSNVNRGPCRDESLGLDCMLRGEDDADGVVVWRGGVVIPSFVSSPEDGRRGVF